MLMNSLGFSSLSMMPSYDGTFSEGRAINAVGLLGAGGMVNIMWTGNAAECCRTEADADVYFQRRLFMGEPLAPTYGGGGHPLGKAGEGGTAAAA